MMLVYAASLKKGDVLNSHSADNPITEVRSMPERTLVTFLSGHTSDMRSAAKVLIAARDRT